MLVEASVQFLAYSGFHHSRFLFFKKDVQWSFPVFHVKTNKKKTHLQTILLSETISYKKQQQTLVGDVCVTQEKGFCG